MQVLIKEALLHFLEEDLYSSIEGNSRNSTTLYLKLLIMFQSQVLAFFHKLIKN